MSGGIKLTSEITVRPIQHVGGDAMVVAAARVSTCGEEADKWRDAPAEDNYGLIRYLMRQRHGSPFEHGSMTFFVRAPIFVFREWHRHRVGFCLAGDTEIYTESICKNGRTLRKRPIAEIWRNWHQGVPDSLGRCRLLASCRHLPLRVANEQTGLFEISRMEDIIQSGVKEVLGLRTSKGHYLKCSRDHQILTRGGWKKAGELERRDYIAVCGKVPIPGDKICPPSLRRGIGVWTSMQRKRLIRDVDVCEGCGQRFCREELVLDHKVPVVVDLNLALNLTNLRPYCIDCHRMKTNSEQVLASGRGGIAGVKYVPLLETPSVVGEEMTYDICMQGSHHNFVANGIVVHNSYNEESARYKELEPVFWIPARLRCMVPAAGFKPSRPQFVSATDEQYNRAVYQMSVAYDAAYIAYQNMIAEGVAREVARSVLPVGIYSSCWVTCNPRSLMHFLSLRTRDESAAHKSYPQAEIEEAARQCELMFSLGWPLVHKAFNECGRIAP